MRGRGISRLSEYPWSDADGHKFLEQQFGCEGYFHLHHVWNLTFVTVKPFVFYVTRGHQPTHLAHMDTVRVGLIKQTVFQKRRGTVRNDRVSFHLARS